MPEAFDVNQVRADGKEMRESSRGISIAPEASLIPRDA